MLISSWLTTKMVTTEKYTFSNNPFRIIQKKTFYNKYFFTISLGTIYNIIITIFGNYVTANRWGVN